MKRFIVMLCVVAVCTGVSFAKGAAVKQSSAAPAPVARQSSSPVAENPGRDALGISYQINGGANFVTYRHWSGYKTFIDGMEGLLSFNKNSNLTTVDLAGKVMHSIKKEQNLTAYSFGMIGIETHSGNNVSSGTDTFAAVGLGVEFFFQEFRNLSFCAEAGFGYSSPNSQYGTMAGGLPTLGVKYYF